MALTQISTKGIKDGTITNADIGASAAIAGTKISPDFGSQNIVTTGGLTVDTTTLKVDASNNRVGIGTASPDQDLHVFANHANAVELRVENTEGFIRFRTNNNVASYGAQQHIFKNSGLSTEYMRIDSSGKVGIGTTSPVNPLHVVLDSQDIATFESTSASNSGAQVSFKHTSASPADNDTVANLTFDGRDDSNAATTYAQLRVLATDVSNNSESGAFQFFTRNTGSFGERMRIDSSGRLGIGTTTGAVGGAPSSQTGQFNVISSAASGQWAMQARADNVAGNGLFLRAGNSSSYYTAYLTGYNEANVHMVVRGDGNVGIGTASPAYTLDVVGDGGGAFSASSNSTQGQISIVGKNSSGSVSAISRIKSHPDGSSNQSHMAFETRNSSNSMVEAMRIDSSGNVLINQPSEAAGKIGIKGTNSNGSTCYAVTNSGKALQGIDITCTTVGNNNFGGAISFGCGGNGRSSIAAIQDGSDDDRNGLSFFTHESTNGADNAVERVRFLADGDCFLGNAKEADRMFQGNTRGFVYDNDGNGNHPFIGVQHGTKTSGAAAYISFQSQTGERGKIAESNLGNNVTYNTSSDYRLKQDEVPISDGITRLKQLKPYQFKWKDNPEYGYVDGFFAHEVGDVIKGAATGFKDEVVTQEGLDNGTYHKSRSVGDVVAQGLDYSRLTPLLVAALQEAISKVEVLETEVAALKAS